MKRLGFMIYFCTTFAFAAPQAPRNPAQPDSESTEVQATIEGLLRDAACPIQNSPATATEFNRQCLFDCVKQGSPIIILTRDGTIYLPSSDPMPDADQRQHLLPFVGRFVRISGTVFERKGTRGIAIKEIKEIRDVHLNTDAK
ncbi:MAG TPA: hypothetical protein VNO32_31655 [Candidatus Acidoferrum sp.]|jgi:hypothetical protein|nr:hypothetical protein [Candidatus Acidoferrum sp.]